MKQISPETGICFFRVGEAQPLRPFLASRDFSPLTVRVETAIDEWLEYGCVYVDGKRQRDNVFLRPAQVVRLHTRRRHYVKSVDVTSQIVLDHEEFLVLDKPPGLPTHPTLDNYIENAKTLLERELKQPLFTTHRLDIPTEGLLILAKSADAQRLINKNFSLARVKKTYRAIAQAPVPVGPYIHYMDPESRLPKVVANEAHPGWWTCRLNIERAGEWNDSFWHELRLLTGKTHQIRAQLAHLGAPILGDTAYGAEKKYVLERIALECYGLSFAFRSGTFAVTRPKSIIAPHIYYSSRTSVMTP